MISSARSSDIEPRHAVPISGADLLEGAVDNHVHTCPHINGRSIDVFQAVWQAADAGMRGIGLMDDYANSSGIAALGTT